ncbi:MAG: hypothetical protein Q4D56_08140 [Bacteroides sp.]|nr:hypothetical protein [Bacteroides sp.]
MRNYVSYIITTFITFSLLSCNKLAEDTNTKDNHDSITVNCNRLYEEARQLQNSQQYDQAIEAFKACLAFDVELKSPCDQLLTISVNALLQLMNTYQSKGAPEECVSYLRTLPDSSAFIRRYALRDYYSILGYALSRTERMGEAEEAIDMALSLPLHCPTPQRLFRDYAYAAAVYYSNPNEQERVVNWCKQALHQAELCENTPGAQWVTSLLASLYKRMGRLSESIELLQQSIDEARLCNDTLGELNAYNMLTDLFLYWHIPQYANSYVSKSINMIPSMKNRNPMVMAAAYIMKGRTMQQLDHPDSAFYFYRQANEYCQALPYNSGQADIDLLTGTYLTMHCTGDSLHIGMDALQKVASQATPVNRAKAFHQLAIGYLKDGEERKAEAALDSMYTLLHQSKPAIHIEMDYEPILMHYLQKQNFQQTARYARFMLEEYKVNTEREINMKMSEAIVKIQTEKKEQQLQITQIKLNNSRLQFSIFLLVSLAIVGTLIAISLYRRRIYRIRQRMANERLSILTNALEASRQYSNHVEQQLSDLLTDSEKRKNIEALTPGLLYEKGEAKFRQRFEQLYPRFVPTLREKAPGIGRREELLCMLIVLGQDNQQIADLMNIAPRSVLMARHRLRQKFGLNKEDSLEDIIKELMK